MPGTPPSPEPLILTPAEMAVVFQHLLGPSAAEGGLLGNLDLSPPALAAARARLLERGLLRAAPDRAQLKTFIAPGARALLGAVTRPLMLCVLQVMVPGQDERGAYFSWTPDMLVFNSVDPQGNHRLEPLSSLEALADRALAASGLSDFSPSPAPLPATPDAVGQAAGLRAVFMTVASARTAHEQVHGLAWMISAGRLWLMAPQPTPTPAPPPSKANSSKAARQTPRPSPRPPAPDASLRALPPAELRGAILAAASQAVEHTESVLQAAAA
jgi:hypothetical protein